jgi:hypothetical protein
LALAVRFASEWIAPKERIRRLAMNCGLMGQCAGLVFMTLALKAQTANNLQKFLLTQHQWLGVLVVPFLPMVIVGPILKYYYRNSVSSFLK